MFRRIVWRVGRWKKRGLGPCAFESGRSWS